jgi:hypothetical protein
MLYKAYGDARRGGNISEADAVEASLGQEAFCHQQNFLTLRGRLAGLFESGN